MYLLRLQYRCRAGGRIRSILALVFATAIITTMLLHMQYRQMDEGSRSNSYVLVREKSAVIAVEIIQGAAGKVESHCNCTDRELTQTPVDSRSHSEVKEHSTTLYEKHDDSNATVTLSAMSKHLSFAVAKDFTFPHNFVYRPVNEVLASLWVKDLKQFLQSVHPSKLVTVTCATYSFVPNLLNWLVSAQVIANPPLENVLVISFDEHTHKLLTIKDIKSIYVPFWTVLRIPIFQVFSQWYFGKIWMARMAVMRLINHWGFDVQHFDTDAIILKNPQPIFESFPNSDVIGQKAMMPFELGYGLWGFTLCMGAILFRSTPQTELLWKAIHKVRVHTPDDQKRLNFALYMLKIKWLIMEVTFRQGTTGIVGNSGLQVVVLPPIYICREECNITYQQQYYVWHKGYVQGHNPITKISINGESGVWFLRRDWNATVENSEPRGKKWLEYLAGKINY